MAWKQLVQPNVAINETAGLCLQYAKRAFNNFTSGTNAWDAWEAAQYKHRDRNFPEGVAVPVWFDWTGTVKWTDGIWRTQRYGHAAVRMPDGKIWSSPLTGHGRAWFASVDDLARAFGGGMTYVGWSEDISGTRVTKDEGGDMPIPDADNYYWRYGVRLAMQVRGRELTREEFRQHIVGKTDLQVVELLSDDPEANVAQNWQEVGRVAVQDRWAEQIYRLQDQVAVLSKRPSDEQIKSLQSELDTLSKSAEDALANAEKARLEADAARLKNAELLAQAEADKQAGETVLRRIGQFISKYLPGNK
ncbi:hypothetical protein [Rhodococcus pyridinivorans]|uniref:hypothetical protein n=1 Tax=Rhodococcus pyridinivorans TaxID=103816 RepID=UPI000B22FBB7|nr:hypothetical protein [Rhodococcus pyridinivorans]